jgi:hypothetical protein
MLQNERVIDAAEMILEYRQNTPLASFLEHVDANALKVLRHRLAEEPGENAAQLEVLMTEVALECSVARVDRENEEVLRAEKMSSQSLTKLNESLMSLASNAKEARNRNPTPNPNT